MNFASRRRRAAAITAAVAIASFAFFAARHLSLRPVSFPTGWTLFAAVVALAAYNLRRKLPFLPLGSASAWTQFHLYLGILSVLLFLVHVRFRLPNGTLDSALAALYALVAASGVAGLLLSRSLPPRLARAGENVLFERIPALRARLRERLEAVIVQSASEAGSPTLSEFCTRRVVPFFEHPGSAWRHLLEIRRSRDLLLAQLEDLDRYLDDPGRACKREVADLIRAKDDLDHQRAGQGILKYWLFVHVPLTWGLLIVAAAHGLLAHVYAAGGP